MADPAVAERLAATQAQRDLLAALVADRWAAISLDADDDALSQQLVTQVNDLVLAPVPAQADPETVMKRVRALA